MKKVLSTVARALGRIGRGKAKGTKGVIGVDLENRGATHWLLVMEGAGCGVAQGRCGISGQLVCHKICWRRPSNLGTRFSVYCRVPACRR